MGAWSKDSKSHVATMGENDFASNEKSMTIGADDNVKIALHTHDGEVITLKNSTPLIGGEIIDISYLSKKALLAFFEKQIAEQKNKVFYFHCT